MNGAIKKGLGNTYFYHFILLIDIQRITIMRCHVLILAKLKETSKVIKWLFVHSGRDLYFTLK